MEKNFEVDVTEKDMYCFLMNNTYRKFTGIICLMFSAIVIFVAVYTWKDVPVSNTVLLIIMASFYTVITPVLYISKAKKQIKYNDYFKHAIFYSFGPDGVCVKQNEDSVTVGWNEIWKAVRYNNIVTIYVTSARAFIIPIRCVGDDYDDFIDILSDNLKERCKIRKRK